MDPQPGDSLISLLDELQGIVEPPPVSMLPATWGWAVLAALVLAALVAVIWLWHRRRRRTAYRRAALAELRILVPDLAQGHLGALAALSRLIRRTALAAFPRAEVATLTGADWIAFLNRTGGTFDPFIAPLANGPYAPRPANFDGPALVAAARHWITRHHA